MTTTLPVLIVGAGPTGLTMALCLERYGISFRIIDKQIKPVTTSNALAVQTRTLEIWDDLGLLPAALNRGNILQQMDIYHRQKKLAYLNLEGLKSLYPFILGLSQSETEKLLLEQLQQKNITVEMQVELREIEQYAQDTQVTLQHPDGRLETVSTQWVIACDGGHSTLREKVQLPFVGQELAQHFVLADVNLTSDHLKKNHGSIFLSEDGVLFILYYNKTQARIIADVTNNPELRTAKKLTQTQLAQIIAKRCPFNLNIETPKWTSGFWVHERMMTRYRQGSIFFVGDAAHIHSPVGGQGMNTGIQDAYNLAWKLAFVLQHRASAALLDSYQEERKPIAKKLLKNTTRLTQIITTSSSWLKKLRDAILVCLLHFPSIRKQIAMHLTELALHYANSSLTQDGLKGHPSPHAGSRMLDVVVEKQRRLLDWVRGKEYTLLLFDGQKSETQLTELHLLQKNLEKMNPDIFKMIFISANESKLNAWKGEKIYDKNSLIHQHYSADSPLIFLIRPDKYIGFRSRLQDQAALRDYLEKKCLLL